MIRTTLPSRRYFNARTAQIFQSHDCDSFEEPAGFGSVRSRKIMDAFREIVNLFALESIAIEDQVGIELNVSSKKSLISKTWFRVCPSLTRNPLACAFAHRRVLRLVQNVRPVLLTEKKS